MSTRPNAVRVSCRDCLAGSGQMATFRGEAERPGFRNCQNIFEPFKPHATLQYAIVALYFTHFAFALHIMLCIPWFMQVCEG